MTSKTVFPAMMAMIISCWAGSNESACGENPARGSLGFIRLLDAVSAGSGSLECLIDGKAARPGGYQLGNVTGGIALPPKSYRVLFRREGVKEGETRVMVEAGVTTTLIAFAEQVSVRGEVPVCWEMRVLRLKQHEAEDKRTATLVSVSSASEIKVELRQSTGLWEAIYLKRLGLVRAEIRQARGYLPLRCNGQPMAAVSVGGSGNFVTVFYDDEHGMLRATNFQDYKHLSTE